MSSSSSSSSHPAPVGSGAAAALVSAAGPGPAGAVQGGPAGAGAAAADPANQGQSLNDQTQRQLSEVSESNRVTQQLLLEQLEMQVVARAEQKQRDVDVARSSAEETARAKVRGLKQEANRSKMSWVLAVCGVPDDTDRMKLGNGMGEALATLEDGGAGELDEANTVLESATKKMTSISKDKQEELYKQVKMKKRSAAAAGMGERAGGSSAGGTGMHCTRCFRDNHSIENCIATTISGGRVHIPAHADDAARQSRRAMVSDNLGLGAPRGGYGRGVPAYQSPYIPPPYGAVGVPGYGPGYETFFPPTNNSNFYGPGVGPGQMHSPMGQGQGALGGVWQQRMQQRGYGGRPDPRQCHSCGQFGHIIRDCPMRTGAAAAGAGIGPASAGAPVRALLTGMRDASASTALPSICIRETQAALPVQQMANADIDTHRLRIAPVSTSAPVHVLPPVDRDSAAKNSQMADADAQRNHSDRVSGGARAAEDDSMASLYASSAWAVEEESVGEDGGEDEQTHVSQQLASMYTTSIGSSFSESQSHQHTEHELQSSLSSSVPVLTSKPAREEQLLQQVEWTGMASEDTSLRLAIRMHFQGKKKILSEADVLDQICERCTKRGHRTESCPDQTQREEHDRSESDKWVRALLQSPRIRIAEVNRDLTLEEGMSRWLERGAELNVGNPWVGSKRKEDALRAQLGFHKAMGMSSVHLGWIGFGVPLQFVAGQPPAPLAFRNHKSAMEEGDFVDSEHAINLAAGSYVEVRRDQLRGICPLQVEKNPTSGKRRLCQDLRWINGHLPNVEFRMESLHTELGDVVQQGDKLLTTDIDRAYYCVPLHPSAQPYLGWQWRGKYYMPTCLVFGLSTAPRVFTKLMRPMMAFMRSLCVRVLGMIDDYMWAERAERMLALRSAVQQLMRSLGWKLNAKCVWDPSDEVLMLGMLVNTKEFVVKAPAKKIEAAESSIHRLLANPQPNLRSVQRVTGQLMSMMLALPAVRVFTRALYRCIAIVQGEVEAAHMRGARPAYEVHLTEEAREELHFWLTRLHSHNALPINSRESQVEVLLWSDASDVGWGGEAVGVSVRGTDACTALASEQQARRELTGLQYGSLPLCEIASSSTRRELVGLLQLVSTPSILQQVQGHRVKIYMDSIPALRNLINGGGPKQDLTQAVRQWTELCEKHRIQPTYEWIPRAENWRADKASKLHVQQFTFASAAIEVRVRAELGAAVGSLWRQRENHWLGRVALFLPMFHQVDARIEMIRSSLEEAIIVVPEWPGGATRDWYRRLVQHSAASVPVGTVRDTYREYSGTGHNEQLRAFWLMGRRGDRRRRQAESEREGGQTHTQ